MIGRGPLTFCPTSSLIAARQDPRLPPVNSARRAPSGPSFSFPPQSESQSRRRGLVSASWLEGAPRLKEEYNNRARHPRGDRRGRTLGRRSRHLARSRSLQHRVGRLGPFVRSQRFVPKKKMKIRYSTSEPIEKTATTDGKCNTG